MKDKLTEFFHRLPLKIYLLLAGVLLFAFVSNNFELVDIQKTAIVLAVGIDSEEKGYTLTAQIALPAQGQSTPSAEQKEIQGKGETVSECIAELYARTGRVPKFIFCDLILLGEQTARKNGMGCLDFFLRNEYVSDACAVAVCEGRAGDVLTAKSALDDSSSASIGKLFTDASESSGRISKTNLKEFAIGYFGVSESGYTPFVRAKPARADGKSAPKESEQGGGDDAQAGEDKKIFTAEQTALFYQGRMTALLTPEETFAFQLLQGNVFSGSLSVQTEEGAHSLVILKDKGSVALEKEGAPKAILDLFLRVDLQNRENPSAIDEISRSLPNEKVRKKAEEKLTAHVQSLWEKSVKSGCDLFSLKRDLYRSSKKEYLQWKDTLFSAITPQISVKIENAK